MSTEPNEADVIRLANELIESIEGNPAIRPYEQMATFVLQHFIRRSAILPEGITIRDVRNCLLCTQSPGSSWSIEEKLFEHLLAICEGEK